MPLPFAKGKKARLLSYPKFKNFVTIIEISTAGITSNQISSNFCK
jgi:hypothetical protein